MTLKNPQDPEWVEIAIQTDPLAREALASFLFDLGCEGLVQEDFHDTTLRAYLSHPNDFENIRSLLETFIKNLRRIFPEIPSPKLKMSEFKNQDWSLKWRRFFHADRVTEKLMVLPPWESLPQNFDGHLIRIDPGLAFGTGRHPTTRMCLQIMEKISLPESWTMLDVGTGSGILAIYGAMLGARNVLATDIDPGPFYGLKKTLG
ncbi:MAG: 50S ribosomal protein L11 methyltransferase [Pseudomonadota bacterium]